MFQGKRFNPEDSSYSFYVPIEEAEKTIKENQEATKRVKEYILKEESNKPFPYLDSKNIITIGYGKNIDNLEMFISEINREENYSRQEKIDFYYKLKSYSNRNLRADFFEKVTPLRISLNTAENLYENHIKDDMEKLSKGISGWGVMPTELKDVLTDIRYNTGPITRGKWKYLREGLDARDFEQVLKNVNHQDVPESRNRWAIEQILKTKNHPFWKK